MRCPNPACACPVNPEDNFCPHCRQRLDEITKTPPPEPALAPALAQVAPGEKEAQSADLRSQAPEVQPAPPAVTGKVGGTNRIRLEFDQMSWVEIKQANGKVLLSQLNPAGTMQLIEGVPPFDLVIGNAAKVRMKYNDTPVDLRPYFKVDVARLALD